ncbi:MAG: hypothetical protein CL508_05535 [Actinobacteria bacterium]|nr:hypothetical protein [Actinomycetota bacterium]|tara:strand:- start:5851 stop:6048 length:198 start_codon:yes stop_codon:yes gene_type:complete
MSDSNKENIFNSPMQLRKWAVELIDNLGSPVTQTGPNTEQVDKLLSTFVNDYNIQFEMQTKREEE